MPTSAAARVLFCLFPLVALHGFIKKTRTTPDQDFELHVGVRRSWTNEVSLKSVRRKLSRRSWSGSSPSPWRRKTTNGCHPDDAPDPKNNITLSSLQRAAALVGRRAMIELV
jgi:hypothetical protein